MNKSRSKQIKKTKSAPQNGKGDAPRNISEKFKNNYAKINWTKKKIELDSL